MMNKNLLIQGAGGLIVLVLIIIGVTLYLNEGTSSDLNGTLTNSSEGARIIMDSISHRDSLTAYHYIYNNSNEVIDSQTEIIRNNNDYYIKTSDIMGTVEYYISNDTIVCVQFKHKDKICTSVLNDTYFDKEIKQIMYTPVNKKETESSNKYFSHILNTNAIQIQPTIINKTISGETCQQIKFSTDYSILGITDLSAMGISTNDPRITRYDDFSRTICYHTTNGLALENLLEYSDAGEDRYSYNLITYLSTTNATDIELPVINGNNETTKELYKKMITNRNKIYGCHNSNDNDACLKESAYQNGLPIYCYLINNSENKDQCIDYMLGHNPTIEMCQLMSTEYRQDLCYEKLVSINSNNTFCNLIINQTVKERCDEINVTTNEQEIQCVNDSDCIATGCSNAFCAPLNNNLTFTTCDYKSYYACYQPEMNLTSCSCVNGKCDWERSEPFSTCVENGEMIDLQNELDEIAIEMNTDDDNVTTNTNITNLPAINTSESNESN